MSILITGATGFIGSKILDALRNKFGSNNIIVLSSKLLSDCDCIVYKNTNHFDLKEAELAKLSSVEMVIHAGAYTPKKTVEANNIEGCNQNISYTEQLLKLPFPSLKKIVFLSTIDVYQNVNPIDELTATLPITLYGQSKLYCEKMVEYFSSDKNITSQILRIGHVYGPGEEKYSKVIPNTIKNIITEKPVELWGDGSELRSFIYIDDVVTATLNALNIENSVGVVNVVGGREVSIKHLIDMLIAVSGKEVEINKNEFTGIKRDCTFNTSKMNKHLLRVEKELSEGLKIEYEYVKSKL